MPERLKTALDRAREERRSRTVSFTTGPARPKDIESALLLPVPQETSWQSIPEATIDPARLADARISAVANDMEDGNSFNALGARLHDLFKPKGWRRLAITAPTRGCGTTTFALNLAFSFVRQSKARVLLLDLHHAAPAIARILGLVEHDSSAVENDNTLRELTGLYRFGEQLLISGTVDGRSGMTRQRDAEAIARLDRLQAKFQPDLVVMDLPPALSGAGNDALLNAADAALLVVSAEQTTAPELDESAHRISGATGYLGAALNKSTERTVRRVHGEFAWAPLSRRRLSG